MTAVIDPAAAEAHAWLAGYSRGVGDLALDKHFTDTTLQYEYEKGWKQGNASVGPVVKR